MHHLARHPEICIQAVQAARNLPPADLSTLRPFDPPPLRLIHEGRIQTLRPRFAWTIQYGVAHAHPRALVLAESVDHFDPLCTWTWPRLRAGIRLAQRAPTWLVIHTRREAVLRAIGDAFADQRDLMPVLVGPHPYAPENAPESSPLPRAERSLVAREAETFASQAIVPRACRLVLL